MFELVVAILFLCLSIAICVMAWTLPASLAPTFMVSAGGFPFVLGVILTLLSIWWVADMVLRIKHEKQENPAGLKKPWLDELLGDRTQKIRFVIIVVAVLVYAFLLIPVFGDISRDYGFVIASFLFLCVTIKVFNEISWVKTIVISAFTVVVIYVVFYYALKVIMPT